MPHQKAKLLHDRAGDLDASKRAFAILDASPDGILALDSAECCVYVNPAAERLLGRHGDEILGRNGRELFSATETGTPGGTAFDIQEYRAPSHRWLEIRSSPAPDGGLTLYLRDITDRRQAEEQLRRSQLELLDFIENATEGLHWVGPDGTILWANQAELDLLGYTREEYIGHSIAEFHADTDVIEDILCQLTSGRELHNREARLRGKDGTIRHVLINSNVLWFEGEFIHTRCFTRDITERKRAEEELRSSEQRFSRFMEHLPGLAWMKDLEGRYTYVNAAAALAFGRPPAEIHGRTDGELFPAGTAAQFRLNDWKALESTGGVLVVETLNQPDGAVHHSLVSKFPVPDADGRLAAVGGMAIDITDRIAAEEALREADRRKDEFLAMLAHELRNPLSPILTAVEIFRLRDIDDPILVRQRATIERQVTQMKRLLDDLLDVARITRGKVQLCREPVDLGHVLTQAAETSRPMIEERQHNLDVSLPEAPLVVDADPFRLAQVFTNLLNNAAKYTEPGGHIRLTVERRGEEATICVKDSGIGMTPELIGQAFELFAQGDRALDRSAGGLGIGLTLVRDLVEMHGGSVRVHSEGPNRGTEFVVTLPLSGEGDAPGSEPREESPPR
jgi:PAS domain S-box-containing protein